MNFSSTIKSTAPLSDLMKHPATILKNVSNDGAFKLYIEANGHAQRAEITLPEGRVIIIKDYEELPAYAHYKSVMVLSPQDAILGSLNIVPEDRKRPSSMSQFFDGNNTIIGTGSGDIGMAIASQLFNLPSDPRQSSTTFVDSAVISSIKTMLESNK